MRRTEKHRSAWYLGSSLGSFALLKSVNAAYILALRSLHVLQHLGEM